MYARHLAWLNATPEGSKKSRREEYTEGGEGSPFLLLPNVEEAEYLVRYWHEAGTVSQGGMGIAPLSWQEIRAWRLENELSLATYEINLIRQMSVEYVGEYHSASAKDRPAPYQEFKEEEFDRAAVGNKIFNVLSSFKKKKDEPTYEVE